MQYLKQSYKNFFVQDIKIQTLLLNDLKVISKSRGIKDCKSKSKDELIKILSKPKRKIEQIRKTIHELRKKFLSQKKKKIRRNLYEEENKKIKEIENDLLELEKNICKTDKKYSDYNDIEYEGMRDVRNSFDLSIDKDYYKPIKSIMLLVAVTLNLKV